MTHRIKVDDLHTVTMFDNDEAYCLRDNTDGTAICQYRFEAPQKGPQTELYDAHRAVAQAIADALNAAPNAAIERIRQTMREVQHLKDRRHS